MSKPCGVYVACPMTGYDKQEMNRLARESCYILESHGLKPWCPILEEKIEGQGNLQNDKSTLNWKWPMDKQALNDNFVFLNLKADDKSFGCEREHGRHRNSEWQPVVIISPKHCAGYTSIANYEDDLIVPDIETAAKEIQLRWGKWSQRIVWKLKIWLHAPYWFWRQSRRLFQ